MELQTDVAKYSKEQPQLPTPDRTPTPPLLPTDHTNEGTDTDQQSVPSGGEREDRACDATSTTSGNLPFNARWEMTTEPPSREITSDEI